MGSGTYPGPCPVPTVGLLRYTTMHTCSLPRSHQHVPYTQVSGAQPAFTVSSVPTDPTEGTVLYLRATPVGIQVRTFSMTSGCTMEHAAPATTDFGTYSFTSVPPTC